MIFATVGTHEQQFNRMIKKLDNLKGEGIVKEEIVVQTGYCDYSPKYCKCKKMLSFEEMNNYAKNARVIITHGGPASIFLAYSYNKIPIVIPRQRKFSEHVDDHQLLFARRLSKEKKLILVEDIEDLSIALENYDNEILKLDKTGSSNNKVFIQEFEKIVNSIM